MLLNWLHRSIRFLLLSLVRLFYPQIELHRRKNIPTDEPVVFVLNHPNGLLDPLILMAALNRPLAFLAKSTLFGNPVGKTFMEAFGALPVYRQVDDGKWGGPRGDMVKRNEQSFARCRALLRQHRPLALFPEGTTHSHPKLLRLRSGAARIALGAADEFNWQPDVKIVPVGLWYRRKTDFRTAVLLTVGQPVVAFAFPCPIPGQTAANHPSPYPPY